MVEEEEVAAAPWRVPVPVLVDAGETTNALVTVADTDNDNNTNNARRGAGAPSHVIFIVRYGYDMVWYGISTML